MFFDRLNDELVTQNFVQFPINQPGIFAYTKYKEGSRAFIVLVNLPEEITGDVFHIKYSLQQVKQQVNDTDYDKFLFVYLTDQPDAVAKLCEDTRDVHWVVDRSHLRLVVYEHQPNNFYKVRECIENALNPKKAPNKKYTSYVTAGIIGINVLIYIIMYWVCSYDQRAEIEAWGGMFWPYITKGHEYWRLITSMFLHSGISHLFNNMLFIL